LLGGRSPALRVIAVIGLVEFWINTLFTPCSSASLSGLLLKIIIPLGKVAIYSGFGGYDRGMVAIVDYGSGHAIQHGFNNVKNWAQDGSGASSTVGVPCCVR
jgi:hypothetical protein